MTSSFLRSSSRAVESHTDTPSMATSLTNESPMCRSGAPGGAHRVAFGARVRCAEVERRSAVLARLRHLRSDRMVFQACQVMRKIRAVIAKLTNGSAILIPAATPTAEMITPSDTNPSTRA